MKCYVYANRFPWETIPLQQEKNRGQKNVFISEGKYDFFSYIFCLVFFLFYVKSEFRFFFFFYARLNILYHFAFPAKSDFTMSNILIRHAFFWSSCELSSSLRLVFGCERSALSVCSCEELTHSQSFCCRSWTASTETDFKRHFPWCPAAVSESNSRGLDESADKVSEAQKAIGLKGKCCIGSGRNLIQCLYDMNDVTVR